MKGHRGKSRELACFRSKFLSSSRLAQLTSSGSGAASTRTRFPPAADQPREPFQPALPRCAAGGSRHAKAPHVRLRRKARSAFVYDERHAATSSLRFLS